MPLDVYSPPTINHDGVESLKVRMTDDKVEAAFRDYLKTFSMTLRADREGLIRACVTEDLAFSNPGVDGRGADVLLAHIDQFQDAYPGGRFRINWLRRQHGQILAEWTQLNGDGSELVTAHSYARVDETGRITRFAGFWEPF